MHTDKTEKEQAEIYFRIKNLIPPDQNDAWEWVADASRYPASLDAISATETQARFFITRGTNT